MKNKIINIIKDKYSKKNVIEILFWIAIAMMIINAILSRPLIYLDEMWNYNFSKNILEGRLPYKDFNIIQMPLTPYIGAIFLKILGNQMFSMRILAIICSFGILKLFYKILEKTGISKYFIKLVILIIMYMFYEQFTIDYNFFLLLILLSIIYIEIKNKQKCNKENKKIDIILGCLAGLCICTKQSTGLCVAIVTIFYQIMFVHDKETFKIYKRKVLYRIIGVLIPIFILCIYFTVFDLWDDFINYAIMGIRTFDNKVPYFNLMKNDKWHIRTLSVIILIYLVVNLMIVLINKFIRKEENDYENISILAYSWASIAAVYPISDETHFLLGSLISLLNLSLIFYKVCKQYITKKFVKIYLKSLIQIFVLVISIDIFVTGFTYIVVYCSDIDKWKQINHFWYIPNSEYSRVRDVSEYIKNSNKKVYIFDAQAVLYTIPIDQYTKNYDMLLKGNIGFEGDNKIINEIKEMTDTQILIMHDHKNLNWQTPMSVIEYIKNNLIKVGEVGAFDIYQVEEEK